MVVILIKLSNLEVSSELSCPFKLKHFNKFVKH